MSAYFYELPSKLYRYWLSNKRLMIQMKRKDMATFRCSAIGKQVERHADIFEVGGGWYEITGKTGAFGTMPDAIREVIEPKAGHKVWVAALNASFLSTVNANPPSPYEIVLRKPGDRLIQATTLSPSKLEALAAKFGQPKNREVGMRREFALPYGKANAAIYHR